MKAKKTMMMYKAREDTEHSGRNKREKRRIEGPCWTRNVITHQIFQTIYDSARVPAQSEERDSPCNGSRFRGRIPALDEWKDDGAEERVDIWASSLGLL